jgi:hypothetical protein
MKLSCKQKKLFFVSIWGEGIGGMDMEIKGMKKNNLKLIHFNFIQIKPSFKIIQDIFCYNND